MVNPVVKAVFRPGSATRRNGANACAARLSGLRLLPTWMALGTHPKQARFLLRFPKKSSALTPCLDFFDRGHSLGSLFPPPAAVASTYPPLRPPIPVRYSRPPIGARPRNCLAASAAGSASELSPKQAPALLAVRQNLNRPLERIKARRATALLALMVRVGRLELPASCSQSRRATNCATPGDSRCAARSRAAHL